MSVGYKKTFGEKNPFLIYFNPHLLHKFYCHSDCIFNVNFLMQYTNAMIKKDSFLLFSSQF